MRLMRNVNVMRNAMPQKLNFCNFCVKVLMYALDFFFFFTNAFESWEIFINFKNQEQYGWILFDFNQWACKAKATICISLVLQIFISVAVIRSKS